MEQVSLEEERPEHTVQLGEDMTALDRQSQLSLLRGYKGVFAFGPEEMPSITTTVIEHRLNMDPRHRPAIQKKRHMGPERAGLIREYQYPEWISNVVLVTKPNRTWRMGMDFTDLNKACLKD